MALALGCTPAAATYELSAKTRELDPGLQQQIALALEQYSGQPIRPKLLAEPEISAAHLARGYQVYTHYCQPCHGTSGDGNGPAAAFLDPRPRDYRAGIFKFTSTPYGSKPRRADLIRTIRYGAKGTSMPAFKLLSNEDLEAVVDYVLALTHRGELERALVAEALNEEEIAPEYPAEAVEQIVAAWRAAEGESVQPAVPEPPYDEASIELGRQAFLTKGCSKCHGEDGRGQTRENVGTDAWGHATKAADLTTGMFHGGRRPIDLYRRISSGINGTPMPAFKDALAAEPETIWRLAHYARSVSDRKRGPAPSAAPAAEPSSPAPTPAAPTQTEPTATSPSPVQSSP
jgi:mono/diheme cytochrome c family protein